MSGFAARSRRIGPRCFPYVTTRGKPRGVFSAAGLKQPAPGGGNRSLPDFNVAGRCAGVRVRVPARVGVSSLESVRRWFEKKVPGGVTEFLDGPLFLSFLNH